MSIMKGSRGLQPLRGTLRIPGDKSISHRALLLAALAEGKSVIEGVNGGDDVAATTGAVAALGAVCGMGPKGEVSVEGHGRSGLQEPNNMIDARNSGTTMRLLLGMCAGADGTVILTGDRTLRERPMLRVVAPLRAMGAVIEGRIGGDRAPLCVVGGPLQGHAHHSKVASAQVKSALLLAGLSAEGITSVTEPQASRDHTERMLRAAGVQLQTTGHKVALTGGQSVAARRWVVPGDISSAMYLIAGALLVPGSHLRLTDVGLNPTRVGALHVLTRMGADIGWEVTSGEEDEPRGTIEVRHGALRGVKITPSEVPGLIDELPILAVIATQAEGSTDVSGASELRVKESDRIKTVGQGVRALGGEFEDRPDGFEVSGPIDLRGGIVNSEGDHRVALSFAVAGLISSSKVRIEGWGAVETSFPEFLDLLGSARARGVRGMK
jgi:3-phosphoshikimate 1-carboxyvinyltransferase